MDTHRVERLAVESGRPRAIPLRVWYPAAWPGRRPAQVFSDAERVALETEFGLPAHTLDGMGATATRDAPAARGRHRVLLLSHGFGLTTALHTAQATELASRGYVVIGIDHPGDAGVVDAGGGRLMHMNPSGLAIRDASLAERVADDRFVLDDLGAIRSAGRLDRTRIGAFGHSLGGATAAEAMREDRRIDAGIDLDGAVFGPVVESGVARPFGVLVGELPPASHLGLDAFRADRRPRVGRQATAALPRAVLPPLSPRELTGAYLARAPLDEQLQTDGGATPGDTRRAAGGRAPLSAWLSDGARGGG